MKECLKKAWDGLVSGMFVVGSLFCFAMTIFFTFADKMPAATLMASLFVVLMLMHYLPQMEYFKAYGIEAKMRQRLNEADDILAKLKAAAVVSAKVAYHVFGWQSRMSHPVREKQVVADEVDALLKGAGVSDNDLAKIKWQYLRFILYDLDQVVRQSANQALQEQQEEIVRRINAANPNVDDPILPDLRARQERVAEQLRRVRRGLENEDVFELKLLGELPPPGLLDADLEKALNLIKDRVARAGAESFKSGRLTSEAADIIEATHLHPTLLDKAFKGLA